MEPSIYLGKIESIAYFDKRYAQIHLDLAELVDGTNLHKFKLGKESKLRQVIAVVERSLLSKTLPKNINRETRWIEVEFSRNGALLGFVFEGIGINCLESEGRRERFNLRAVESQTGRYLDQQTRTTIAAASREEIERELNRAQAPIGDAISLNVGHGNASVIVDQNYDANFYFDLGGSSLGQWYRIRHIGRIRFHHIRNVGIPDRPVFLTTPNTFVILSHWDLDHWISATDPKNIALMNCIWIAPELTGARPVHNAMMEELQRRQRLLIWPNRLDRVDTTFGYVAKADGPLNNRNNSGLYAELNSRDTRVLLTGDASYDHMPEAIAPYHSLVVPHHGGARLGTPLTPSATRDPRLVYSCGANNSYRHPLPATLASHNAAGWPTDGIQTMLTNKNVSLIRKAPRHGPGVVCPAAPDHSMTCACDATTS